MANSGGFDSVWRSQVDIGRVGTGYRRFAWTDADSECREWFVERAAERDMPVERDRAGNLWAWWGDPTAGDALALGSHLDSVPDGGGYDGPLGVVSAFAAVDSVRTRGLVPNRPVTVACFADEEGARFGLACAGSRLLTGALDPDRARALTDADGVSLADAVRRVGIDPATLGPDPDLLGRIGRFLELHVEQGRGLVDLGAPVGLANRIWPHGRWRLDFHGAANHAGTTALADRSDPMLPMAEAALAARRIAGELGARATIGKVMVDPNGANAIPSRVRAWLDARAAEESTVRDLVDSLTAAAGDAAGAHGVRVEVSEESWTPVVRFPSGGLTGELGAILGDPPVLDTGAGHDAGILAGVVPAAMVFVRNPTGASHCPEEFAERDDCVAGVAALARVIEELACG